MSEAAPYPVPDGTTWTDDYGNVWTSSGDDVVVYAGPIDGEVEVEQIV